MIRSDYEVYAEDTAVGASDQVGDILNHGAPRTDYDDGGLGSGGVQRELHVVVKTSFSESTSQQFVLETASDEAFTAPETLATTPVVAVADLVKGAVITALINRGGQQYSRVRSVGVGTTEASGEVDIFTAY